MAVSALGIKGVVARDPVTDTKYRRKVYECARRINFRKYERKTGKKREYEDMNAMIRTIIIKE